MFFLIYFELDVSGELFTNVEEVIAKWKDLLKHYLHTVDEEVCVYKFCLTVYDSFIMSTVH